MGSVACTLKLFLHCLWKRPPTQPPTPLAEAHTCQQNTYFSTPARFAKSAESVFGLARRCSFLLWNEITCRCQVYCTFIISTWEMDYFIKSS